MVRVANALGFYRIREVRYGFDGEYLLGVFPNDSDAMLAAGRMLGDGVARKFRWRWLRVRP